LAAIALVTTFLTRAARQMARGVLGGVKAAAFSACLFLLAAHFASTPSTSICVPLFARLTELMSCRQGIETSCQPLT